MDSSHTKRDVQGGFIILEQSNDCPRFFPILKYRLVCTNILQIQNLIWIEMLYIGVALGDIRFACGIINWQRFL